VDWTVAIVQWLHIVFGIFWFGAVLSTDFIFFPALATIPVSHQRDMGRAFGERAYAVLRPVALAAIALGILRGTLFGPIRSIDALATAYGITWLVALAAAIGALAWTERVVAPALERVNLMPEADAIGPDGRATSTLQAAIGELRQRTRLELGFFVVILSCMILMRFGL
jgi:hypothetical protein